MYKNNNFNDMNIFLEHQIYIIWGTEKFEYSESLGSV
jgi:hypothetical protein